MDRTILVRGRNDSLACFNDALLSVALSSYADLEGRELLERNKELKTQGRYRIDPKIEKAIQTMLRKREWSQRRARFRVVAARMITQVAVVFLVIGICLGTTFTVSAEFREIIYQLLYSHEERYTQIGIDDQYTEAFYDAEVFAGRQTVYALTYLPENYALQDYAASERSVVVTYATSDKYIEHFNFTQTQLSSSGFVRVDTENADAISYVTIGDSEAMVVVKGDIIKITWQIGKTMLSLDGNCTQEEMLNIAHGIKLLK